MGCWRYKRLPVNGASHPKCLVREAGPEPVSYPAACSSEYSDVWMEAMRMEFDGFVAAGTFAEVTGIPEGFNVVDAKWL